jgi:cytochrome c551/c552
MSRITASLFGVLALGACGPARESVELPPVVDSVALAQARTAADELGKDLVTMLTGELKRGGPAAAISVCADSAQVRTMRHQAEGVDVRRVSTRVRNAKNAPDSVESAVLAAFADAIAANRPMPDTSFATRQADGQVVTHYMRAIRIQEFCLACHGPADSIGPDVKHVLAARYPGDKATGYKLGELRGAISVTVARP